MTTGIELCRERVAAGANLLDKLEPRWPSMVNITQLTMQKCRKCIIGQVFRVPLTLDDTYGHFLTELNHLMERCGMEVTDDARNAFAINYGFDEDFVYKEDFVDDNYDEGEATSYSYEQLTAAWVDEITRRRINA